MSRLRRPAAVPVLIFAGLVVATFAAFFVTTRLKRAAPVIEQLTFRRSFSPNGDGRFDTAVFAFRLRRSDDATVSIVTRDGDEKRTLVEDVFLERGQSHRFHWNGRDDAGQVAPDGEYHLRVGLRNQGRTVTSSRKLFLDTAPPRMVVRYVSPDSISPDRAGGGNSARLRFTGPSRRGQLLVYRTDLARPRLVARRDIPRGENTVRWDGRVTGGGAAPTGAYLMVVRAQDAAGNVGPRRLPPPRDAVRGNPGLAVSYVSARGPDVVLAGALARFEVAADGRRYTWRVRRLGATRAASRGRSRRSTVTVRAPRGRSGVALLDVRVGARRYTTPFAVRGRGDERVTVVLPAATWQSRNRTESDGDGYPDVLPAQRRVNVQRAFAGDGMPPGFVPDQTGVLRFLDRAGLRYEITTDLELARAGGEDALAGNGVLFVGAPRFVPQQVQRLLVSFVADGGRLAWIGRHGFEWSVAVAADSRGRPVELTSPRRARRTPFGERLRLERQPAPVAVLADRTRFFAGVSPVFGPFGPLEESVGLLRGGSVLAAAGTGAERAALVVFRREDGVVTRIGIDGFGRALDSSPAAERIMRRLWVLLSR